MIHRESLRNAQPAGRRAMGDVCLGWAAEVFIQLLQTTSIPEAEMFLPRSFFLASKETISPA
jgi:hypothetical protein